LSSGNLRYAARMLLACTLVRCELQETARGFSLCEAPLCSASRTRRTYRKRSDNGRPKNREIVPEETRAGHQSTASRLACTQCASRSAYPKVVPAYYRLVNFQQARDDWLSAEPQSEQESYYALSLALSTPQSHEVTAHPHACFSIAIHTLTTELSRS
jgi:hypothetical protein